MILSDILGDPLDMIASGPACPDTATAEDAQRIRRKYSLRMSEAAEKLLDIETPKTLDNVHTQINGSVRELCSYRDLGVSFRTPPAGIARRRDKPDEQEVAK